MNFNQQFLPSFFFLHEELQSATVESIKPSRIAEKPESEKKQAMPVSPLITCVQPLDAGLCWEPRGRTVPCQARQLRTHQGGRVQCFQWAAATRSCSYLARNGVCCCRLELLSAYSPSCGLGWENKGLKWRNPSRMLLKSSYHQLLSCYGV